MELKQALIYLENCLYLPFFLYASFIHSLDGIILLLTLIVPLGLLADCILLKKGKLPVIGSKKRDLEKMSYTEVFDFMVGTRSVRIFAVCVLTGLVLGVLLRFFL